MKRAGPRSARPVGPGHGRSRAGQGPEGGGGAGAGGGAGVRVEGDRVPVWEGKALERLVMTAPDSVTVSDATELYI